MMKNPKVDTISRIVCAYHETLEMYSFHAITKKNKVAKSPVLPIVFGTDFSNAVDRANERSPVKIHKTRFNTVITKMNGCKTWNQFIEKAWLQAIV